MSLMVLGMLGTTLFLGWTSSIKTFSRENIHRLGLEIDGRSLRRPRSAPRRKKLRKRMREQMISQNVRSRSPAGIETTSDRQTRASPHQPERWYLHPKHPHPWIERPSIIQRQGQIRLIRCKIPCHILFPFS